MHEKNRLIFFFSHTLQRVFQYTTLKYRKSVNKKLDFICSRFRRTEKHSIGRGGKGREGGNTFFAARYFFSGRKKKGKFVS